MRAFIVRPFGVKQDIDFDAIQKALIDPALRAAGITGDTTAEILEAGNIRADMFQLLLLADVVVADMSIDNANVYYELGVRHALRSKRTVMIRAKGVPMIPFDLRTDRYLEYDGKQPEMTIPTLTQTLKDVVASDRVDSPVFGVLPDLDEPVRSKMMPVPREFREEVERATAGRDLGRLGLLGWEAEGFTWESGGFRVVGRALFKLRAHEPGRRMWERLRAVDPDDVEANLMLGTIYQRLGDLASSDQALQRVLTNSRSANSDRAEAFALLARNDKSRLPKASPLRSGYLLSSYDNYRRGFLMDLNHFYSGLNALALVSVTLELIAKDPEEWKEPFETDSDADATRQRLERERGELAAAVGLSLGAAQQRLGNGERDIWLDFSIADHQFLTSKRPGRAAAAYKQAVEGSSQFEADSARSQLAWYQQLGILTDRVDLCLAEFPGAPSTALSAASVPAFQRAIVFTGHMVDRPDRPEARFPQSKVEVAKEAIRAALVQLVQGEPERCIGFAGGAAGGDLLFHETCAELGVASQVRLTLPAGKFVAQSVSPSNADWEARFQAMLKRHAGAIAVLSTEDDLPRWLAKKRGYSIWGRTNVWMLEEALATGAPERHLLALWNGKGGDGPGGTGDMVKLAREQGIFPHILDSKQLFGL